MKHTKALIALTLCLFALVLAACGSNKLVGTWTESSSMLGVTVTTEYTFAEDGTGNISISGIGTDFTYTAEDGKLCITLSALGASETVEYTYTIEGDTLTLNGDTVLTKQK